MRSISVGYANTLWISLTVTATVIAAGCTILINPSASTPMTIATLSTGDAQAWIARSVRNEQDQFPVGPNGIYNNIIWLDYLNTFLSQPEH